jgi:GntR family transcriptional regulator
VVPAAGNLGSSAAATACAGDPRLPLHARLRDDLARRIAAGEWTAEAALPGEAALARHYGVAINTLRRALEQLEREGLIERRQGRGTFLRRGALPGSLLRFFRLSAPEDGGALLPEARILSRARCRLAAEAARALGLRPGHPGLHLRRLRLWGGQPLLYERIDLPLPAFAPLARLPEGEFGALLYPLYHALCGRLVVRAEDEISFTVADSETAAALGLPPGTPVVEIRRIAFAADGVPIEARRSRGPAARFRYRAAAI